MWSRLRQETPGKSESYVDLVPCEWTKIRIEVRGDHARLYVHDNPQPTLVVNDVKSGRTPKVPWRFGWTLAPSRSSGILW